MRIRYPLTSLPGPALLVGALLLGGCAGAPSYPESRSGAVVPPRTPAATTHSAGERVALVAIQMVGVPYRYAGSDPGQGFDCSGLVFYSYARSGLEVPRNSQAQFRAARKIALAQAAAGDVMFFQDQQKMSHVGIYLGGGRFVHAPSTGRAVSIDSIDAPYYQEHLVAIGRLIPN